MSRRSDLHRGIHESEQFECPFREFRDNELSADFWGLGPVNFRLSNIVSKTKNVSDYTWVDDQVQPLPRSLRKYLHGWVRAEELATRRWGAEVLVFEENGDKEMSATDIQLSHAQVIMRSSFCRRVLSACYMLERVENFSVEHQWELFTFNIGPEGWRARYHIYSPGVKPGGGQQHRPTTSKNGCYLVRLFYLGAWRCVWVSDQVPVDATEAPLLPFTPLQASTPSSKDAKHASATTPINAVHLWPLLLCKALLKLAAPDMNFDDSDDYEDELMPELDIVHCLTGAFKIIYDTNESEYTWNLLSSEVAPFTWDEDDDLAANSSKSKKKVPTKDVPITKRYPMTSITIQDTIDFAPYFLQGITPGQEMELLVTMVRDLPLKKPLPEPEIPLWKTYRWVDWARKHGLYDEYECPRTKFLKVSGLLKLSHAPNLLDLVSNDSLTTNFRKEQGKATGDKSNKKTLKESNKPSASVAPTTLKEEQRDWMLYEVIQPIIIHTDMLFFPSMYEFTSVASDPPLRLTKTQPNKALDIVPPKSSPLYLQIDGAEENILRISLQTLHPRVLLISGRPIYDYIEPAYLLLEVIEWFEDYEVPVIKGYVETRGYGSMELKFKPGRHICRLWIHSRLQFHVMLLSTSTLLLGSRDLILSAAVKECPWAARFLLNVGTAFATWIRINRSSGNVRENDNEFSKSYQPDMEWVPEVVGYDKKFLEWMFKQALQSLLMRRLTTVDYRLACTVLRKYFYDPDFGLPPKVPQKPLRSIIETDPCDCTQEMCVEEEEQQLSEDISVNSDIINELLNLKTTKNASNICQYTNKDLTCSILKAKREDVVRKHEAATLLQAHWRGIWARKCLRNPVVLTPEILKCIMENVFGNIEALSELMNEFFIKYPGAKSAYSVASALSGTNSLRQYTGMVFVTPQCKWIPYFQGVFYCHAPVKVHFDMKSQLKSVIAVYDDDTGCPKLPTSSAHFTYDFEPNARGYTVMSYTMLWQQLQSHMDVQWQLTVLCSIPDAFHVCDNDLERCKELPLVSSSKFHSDEGFVPNRRNILCGIQVMITKPEVISFRAVATSPELKMEAVLRTTNDDTVEEVGRCTGTGELFWPYIQLKTRLRKKLSSSHVSLHATQTRPKNSIKSKSATKIKDTKIHVKPTVYTIEVKAPNGWPLTVHQWMRVDELRNAQDNSKSEFAKKQLKDKVNQVVHTKDKTPPAYQPQPGDAYVELECSLVAGISVNRDDEREELFFVTRRGWGANDPERNFRCKEVRKQFRQEFLEPARAESVHTVYKEGDADEENTGKLDAILNDNHLESPQEPAPTPECAPIVNEEDAVYFNMPEKLKDKFIPLHFVPLCTQEASEKGSVIMTPEMMEEAKQIRDEECEEALARMAELQAYNQEHVLERQKIRCQMLEKFYTDCNWSPGLTQAFEERDEAIAVESLNRAMSATKKKDTVKKK